MASTDEDQLSVLIQTLNRVVDRQDRFEERLAKLETVMFVPPAPRRPSPPPPPPSDIPPEVANLTPFVEEPVTAPPVQLQKPALESKVGLTWLNRIGVITLVLGVGFFFKWAVDNNWIGPTTRVLLGILSGLLLLGFADYLWRKGQQVYAQGITGAGVAIVYLAFYASFDFYHLLPQSVAFLLLLATTVMCAALALRYNAIAIMTLGFVGAYLIPLLLSNGEDHRWFLISYLLLLNVAATEMARRKTWNLVEVVSFIATVLIFGAWLFNPGIGTDYKLAATVGLLVLCGQQFRTTVPVLFLIGQALTTLGLAFVWKDLNAHIIRPMLLLVAAVGGLAFGHFKKYSSIFFAVFASFWLAALFDASEPGMYMPTGSMGFALFALWTWWRFGRLDEPRTAPTLSIFALNGVIYYALAYLSLNEHHHQWLGLLAAIVAAVYLAVGLALYRKNKTLDSDAVLLSLGLAAAFVTVAIPIQLSGFRITIAWAIEAASLSWIGVRLKKTAAVLAGLIVFALAFLELIVMDSGMYPDAHAYSLILNTRFFVFVVVGVALLLSASWVSKFERDFAVGHFIAGHIVLLGGLCLEIVGWAERTTKPENLTSVETVGITILFAVYAVALVSIGVARRSGINRLAGLVLTGVVILKLYFYDVWQLGRVYQIIAFVILGILLLSTSFLYSKFKGLIEGWRKDE
jgi:uncharacterized membrane protein